MAKLHYFWIILANMSKKNIHNFVLFLNKRQYNGCFSLKEKNFVSFIEIHKWFLKLEHLLKKISAP